MLPWPAAGRLADRLGFDDESAALNWKQLLLSTAARRRVRARHTRRIDRATLLATSALGAARPGGELTRRLASALDAAPEALVLHRKKQGMYAFETPTHYVRVARRGSGRRWLEREYRGWQQLRELGLGALVSPELGWLDLPGGWRALVDLRKEPIAPAELPAALAALVPPMIERARREATGLPATVAFGHARLTTEPELAPGLHLPPLATLEAAFAGPAPIGFFHGDLKDDNIMRLDGRYCLNDLKSCGAERLLDLELLQVIVRHYPLHRDRSWLERLFGAAADDWRQPAMAPLVDLVTLPRPLWQPTYLCHVIGQCYGLEKRPEPNLENRARAFFARRLLRQRLRAALVDLGAPAR